MGRRYLRLEERFDLGAIFGFHGTDDVGHFAVGVGLTDAGEDLAGLFNEAAADQPARALRDAEQGDEEEDRGQYGHTQFPAPFFGPETQGADDIVRQVRDQNSRHDIELEEADQASPFGGGCDFRDIHRADHGRASDRETADKAEPDKGVPVPGERAPQRGDDIEDRQGL